MTSRLDSFPPSYGDERTSRGWGESALIAYPLQYIAFVSVVAYRAFVTQQASSLWGDMALVLALSAAELVRVTLVRHGGREAVRISTAGALGTLVVAVVLRVAGFTWAQSGGGALAAWLPVQLIAGLGLGWRKLRHDEAFRFILGGAAWRSQTLVLYGIGTVGLVRYFLAPDTLASAAPLDFSYAWIFPGFMVSLTHGKSAGSTIRTGTGHRRLLTWPFVLWAAVIAALLIKGTDWRFVVAGVISVAIGGLAAWGMDRNAAQSLDEHLRRRDRSEQGRGGQAGGAGSMA